MMPFMKTPFTCLLLTILCLLPVAAQEDLPNILWITSEDNGPHLGCYGDKYAKTPHLDGLAAKGMRYTNAISSAPVCAPARTAIISGMFPPSTGGQHMRSMAKLPDGFRMYPEFLKDKGYYCTNKKKEDYNLEKTGELWEKSKAQHWKDRKDGQPFFAIFNHTISHESQIRNQIDERDKIHDPANAQIPAYHPDIPEVRKDWAQYYDRLTMMDHLAGENLGELEDAGLSDNTIIFYYGDHGSGMPRSKRWPYNSGLNVPLIVYFPEKWAHLAPADYQAGGVSDRLVSFIDLAPTLLSLIGTEPPEYMQGDAFAGRFQTEDPDYVFGFRERMDERYDMVRSVKGKRYIYLRHYMPHRIYGQYIQYMFATPTTQKWQDMFEAGELDDAQSAFWRPKPTEELYDLETDPDEVVNLADSPDHQEVLAEMRKDHEDWSRQVKDLGFLSEYEFHHRANEAGVTPYEVGHNPDLYDFDSIFAAAQLATSQKEADLPAIVDLLGSDDSGVRYWGATGLLIQGDKGVTAGRDALNQALEDESPIVQVVAAEALGRFGSEEESAKALQLLLKRIQPDEDTFVTIAAWNAIDYLDEKAASALNEIKATSDKPKSPPNGRVANYNKALKAKTLSDLEGS